MWLPPSALLTFAIAVALVALASVLALPAAAWGKNPNLVRIDPKTGTRIAAGSPGGLLEAFKPGTAPPDSYSVIGYEGAEMRGPSPEADSALRSGRGLW